MQPIKIIPLSANRTQVWSQGAEQRAVHLIYDVSAYLDKWPGAMPSVAFERADGEKYAHAFEMDGTVVHIPLLLADTQKSGMCKCMITLTRDDGIANTLVFYGTVTQGIDTLGEAPTDPQLGVIEQVNDAARRAELAAKRAEAAAGGGGGGGFYFETDETLTLANGILSVNTADVVEEDNSLPVTSAAVNTTVGNINALLATI